MDKDKKYGLRVVDKNGREIFQNDKIRLGKHQGTVDYSIDSCSFMVRWDDGSGRQMTSLFAKKVEVVS